MQMLSDYILNILQNYLKYLDIEIFNDIYSNILYDIEKYWFFYTDF